MANVVLFVPILVLNLKEWHASFLGHVCLQDDLSYHDVVLQLIRFSYNTLQRP